MIRYYVLYEAADILAICDDRDTAFAKARLFRADLNETEEPTPTDLAMGRPMGRVYHAWQYEWNAWLGVATFRPLW